MGSKQSVDFGVALEKASHCAGETIHGYVQVNVLTNDVKVPELSVSLVGNAVTHVRYKRTKDDSGKAEETAKETKKILRLNAKVSNIDKNRLVKGTHLQCPFAFAIPVNAVSSMPTLVVGHNKAEISYQISIYATTPGRLYGSCRRPGSRDDNYSSRAWTATGGAI